jgi:MSHA biogenesis protein MshN
VVVVEGGMSVINKMLQDLDRRQAMGSAADTAVVRASVVKPAGREWFWRVLVVLLAAALAWMGWVALQLLPRKPLATDLAFLAANEAQSRPAVKPAAAAPPATPAAAPEPAPAIVAAPSPVQDPVPLPVAPLSDSLRLALQLETPVQEKAPAPAKPAAAKPAPVATKPKAAAAPPAGKSSVDKRDRTRSSGDDAETHFRRAALLLGHGRVSEAEEQLIAALKADPSHGAARQAYVALLLEQQRVEPARHLLQDALATNPEQPTFAFALARIHVESRDYTAALEVLERAGSNARGPEFQALRGAVLQRLGRHGDAVEAYESALRAAAPPANTWIGFAISLEGLGRRTEAAQAYRRALAAGPMAPEARDYAEGRARALQ